MCLCLHTLPWIVCEAGLSSQLGEGLVPDGMWEARLPLCSVPGPRLEEGSMGNGKIPQTFLGSGVWPGTKVAQNGRPGGRGPTAKAKADGRLKVPLSFSLAAV